MANCKDCVHVEVCQMHYRQKCELTYESKREVEIAMRKAQKAVDIECDYYKDRSQLVELPTHLSVSERFEKCSQELINIAKCSETPSRILRIIGENFTELANGYEAVERKAKQALKEREENAN